LLLLLPVGMEKAPSKLATCLIAAVVSSLLGCDLTAAAKAAARAAGVSSLALLLLSLALLLLLPLRPLLLLPGGVTWRLLLPPTVLLLGVPSAVVVAAALLTVRATVDATFGRMPVPLDAAAAVLLSVLALSIAASGEAVAAVMHSVTSSMLHKSIIIPPAAMYRRVKLHFSVSNMRAYS
jgi:hypothetical protein